MGPLSRVRVRALVLALLAVAIGFAVYAFTFRVEPGLYLELKLYRDGDDETFLLDRRDVVWCVFAEAVAPPTLEEDAVKLVWGCFRGRGAVRVPLDTLNPIAEGWVKVAKERKIDPPTFTFGLITRVVVGNASDGKVLYSATDSVALNPNDLLQTKAWKVELKLRKDGLLIESKARETLVTPKLAQPAATEAATEKHSTSTNRILQVRTRLYIQTRKCYIHAAQRILHGKQR